MSLTRHVDDASHCNKYAKAHLVGQLSGSIASRYSYIANYIAKLCKDDNIARSCDLFK